MPADRVISHKFRTFSKFFEFSRNFCTPRHKLNEKKKEGCLICEFLPVDHPGIVFGVQSLFVPKHVRNWYGNVTQVIAGRSFLYAIEKRFRPCSKNEAPGRRVSANRTLPFSFDRNSSLKNSVRERTSPRAKFLWNTLFKRRLRARDSFRGIVLENSRLKRALGHASRARVFNSPNVFLRGVADISRPYFQQLNNESRGLPRV